MNSTYTHDVLIVGGGISGLVVSIELARRGYKVLLLEYYPNFGGRIVTFRDPKIGQYEIGAGRIHKTHIHVHKLIEKYKLHTYPIISESSFETPDKSNDFNELFTPLRQVFEKTVNPNILARNTIRSCLPETYKHILDRFPYFAETNIMRADLALSCFDSSKALGPSTSTDAEFVGITEGIDSLITNLVKEAEEAGVILKSRHRVHDIRRLDTNLFEITGSRGKKANEVRFQFQSRQVILATCRCSLGKFSVLNDAPLLKQLGTSPLLRIYAKYPSNKMGKIWFESLPKLVTTNPLRYIIPINPETGLIMISYTDGDDTLVWKDLDGAQLEAKIQSCLIELFPDYDIPAPIYLQKHYWSGGCTYWLPGTYDLTKAAHEAMNPSPNLYIVGESISQQQAWIEGALESAETFLSRFFGCT